MHYAVYQLTICKLIFFHGLPSTNAHHKLCNNSMFLFIGKRTVLTGDTVFPCPREHSKTIAPVSELEHALLSY